LNEGEIFLNQSASALFGIRSIVGLIPGLAMIVSAAILFFFPLKGERLIALKETILTMHADKAAKLAEMEGGEKIA